MFVRELHLRDFRSWREIDLELRPEPTIFVGRNGFGKTNLLEAVFYLAQLRSHRVSTDAPLVRTGAGTAMVTGTVENQSRELTVQLQINAEGANKASVNGSPARRARDILGILRAVMFAPEDLTLIRGDPADRRRFVDELVAQRGPRFAAARSDYDRVLRQRSALLKTAGAAMRRGGSEADSVISTLDVWDGQLADLGGQVTAARIDVLRELGPHVTGCYASIAPHSRPATLDYRAAAGDEVLPADGTPASVEDIAAILLARLVELRTKEIERGVSLVGPHRDDVDVRLGPEIAKGFASHGESWSLALALRLGSVELIRTEGVEPVIMLDDVFAELDAHRRAQLAAFTESAEQLLITAAVPDDIPATIGGRRVGVGVLEENGHRQSIVTDITVGEDAT
ncbi:DNA replication/repair protein RecF [Gordonia rhizosphera]|uniref:DNA replication and repair protein RecF n=1 Tax=Gordonia rhizosphera NBRC 16068 TaxID=1108045 RepID=K6V962_9ACTN|nr:DNA replication/repair protein RecF [Gordonia rhizosphera]GAB92758.1 DNA replication and repair protein RecF [Gordonia rhizosphera NBRC 16068]